MYIEREARNVNDGDRILCRDGGIRRVYCTYRRAALVEFVFEHHTAETYDPADVIAIVA